jgi:uncharacterized membrane protein
MMSATFASSTWPHASEFAPGPAHSEARPVQWLLKPNCSLSPRQLGAVYLSLCAVSLLIAAGFYLQGVPYVAAFAGIELLAVGVALLVFARHAGDRETITLQGRALRVQRLDGNRVEQHTLPLEWLTVEPAAAQGSLVQLRGRGQQVQVGRWLRPHERALLARQLRQAQRHALAHSRFSRFEELKQPTR